MTNRRARPSLPLALHHSCFYRIRHIRKRKFSWNSWIHQRAKFLVFKCETIQHTHTCSPTPFDIRMSADVNCVSEICMVVSSKILFVQLCSLNLIIYKYNLISRMCVFEYAIIRRNKRTYELNYSTYMGWKYAVWGVSVCVRSRKKTRRNRFSCIHRRCTEVIAVRKSCTKREISAHSAIYTILINSFVCDEKIYVVIFKVSNLSHRSTRYSDTSKHLKCI